jgi:HAE1 family hydrophobic/amphiphilic exporter-1
MQWLAELCVKRPVFATVLSLVILVVGGVFYTQLGVDQFPKIDFPVIVVTTLPGSPPEDVETDITDKIEGAVNTISGIDELRSNSSEGVSQVIIQFKLEKNVDVAPRRCSRRSTRCCPSCRRASTRPSCRSSTPTRSRCCSSRCNAATTVKDGVRRATSDHRHRRPRGASPPGVGQRRRPGAADRRPQAPGATCWSTRSSSRRWASARRGGQRHQRAEHHAARWPRRHQPRLPHAARRGPRDLDRRAARGHRARASGSRHPPRRGGHRGGRRRRRRDLRHVEREPHGAAGAPQAVGHQHGRGRRRRAGADGGGSTELPAGYSLEVQRDGSAVIRTGTEAVTEHLVLGALFAAIIVLMFLGNLRSHIHRRAGHPHLDHRHLRHDEAAGLHAEHHHAAGAGAGGGHRHRRRHRGAREHLQARRREGPGPEGAAIAGTREIGMAVLATTLSLIAVFLPIAFIAAFPAASWAASA